MPQNPERLQRKRQREEPPAIEEALPASNKRRRISPTPARRNPSSFYDSLSKVHLTRAALREFNRRNKKIALKTCKTQVTSSKRVLQSGNHRNTREVKHPINDLSCLRGYASRECCASDTMSESTLGGSRKRYAGSRSTVTGTSDRTKNTTPYDPNFEQAMIDGGVYPDGYEDADGGLAPEPNNLKEILEFLGRERASLSPSQLSEEAFAQFKRANRRAQTEAKAMAEVIPVIAGSRDHQHRAMRDVLFTNAAPLAPGVSPPKPDVYYGASPTQINPQIRRDLAPHIVPSRRTDLPAASNFTVEAKCASGTPDVAQRQAMNNTGYGARAMHHLQTYGNPPPTYDGNAYAIGATYSDGQLKMYATPPTPSVVQPGRTDYYMTQLDSFAMTGNINGFRQGAAAYRNARDWTKEQRDLFIANANSVALRTLAPRDTTSFSSAASIDSSNSQQQQVASDTSADELSGPVTRMKRARRPGRNSLG